jgi:Asp-tRNA(Asn)/Glu-tRNA(Gln) amidotransferase A subunit family amidase
MFRRTRILDCNGKPTPTVPAMEAFMSKIDQQERDKVPAREFAFSKQRKEPLEDAKHVRNAIARFNQVEGVSDSDRDEAWQRILKAAKKFKVEVNEKSWREIGRKS